MKSDELIADEILSDARYQRELNTDQDPAALRSAIVAALEAARDTAFAAGYAAGKVQLHGIGANVELQRHPESPYRGSIIDCTGDVPVVRRVGGTIPLTEEGVVVGVGHYVFMHREDLKPGMLVALTGEHWIGQWMKLRKCYSTESAARAAMEGGKA